MTTQLIKILALILILNSCKSKPTENKSVDLSAEKSGYVLSPEIIDDFFRDDRLNPDNPDFDFYRVDQFSADLNQNQKTDSIFLYKLRGFENDPGDFRQIEIKMDNGDCWTKINFDGWVRFDNNNIIPDLIKNQNQLKTDKFLLTDFGSTKIIGLFSWVYASQPGLLTIIEFSTDKPRIMINRKLDLIHLDQTTILVRDNDNELYVKLQHNKIVVKNKR